MNKTKVLRQRVKKPCLRGQEEQWNWKERSKREIAIFLLYKTSSKHTKTFPKLEKGLEKFR